MLRSRLKSLLRLGAEAGSDRTEEIGGGRHTNQRLWDYKVVQMVAQAPPDATDASRKLGGALSPEALKSQFPEYYNSQNGRQQISEFLNRLGNEGWELVQIQEVAGMPLMFLKRPRGLHHSQNMATEIADSQTHHAQQ